MPVAAHGGKSGLVRRLVGHDEEVVKDAKGPAGRIECCPRNVH